MDIAVLNEEITTDPLARTYSGMTDVQVANDINTAYRPANGGVKGMLSYLLENKHRTNQGADGSLSAILGRLHQVAQSAVGSDPFGATATPTDYSVTLQRKHAAQAFINLLASTHLESLDFNSANLPYAPCTSAGIWSAADVTALNALSINQQSRANELGLGVVDKAHVTFARTGGY